MSTMYGIMLYDTPTKDNEGFYFVKASKDDKKKCFVQLNRVKVTALTDTDVTFNLVSERNLERVQPVDTQNIQAALENSELWFGKALSEETLKSAYTPSIVDGCVTADKIAPTKVFTADQELADFSALTTESECSAILEFAGLWFAKKAFGPVWNVVQVKMATPPPQPEETYPDEFAFQDEDDE